MLIECTVLHLQIGEWPRTLRGLLFLIAFLPTIHVQGVWAQEAEQVRVQTNLALDARNEKGLTPLILAASAGQVDSVHSLLSQGASVNATSADGRTALIAAAQGGHIDIVQGLIAAGANLNASSRGTGTALEVAERKGETEIAALLLSSGARSSGESVGDTVCVLPWRGDGFCGMVKSFSVRSVAIQVTRIMGCTNECAAKDECSAAKPVGGVNGLQAGNEISVPSWCLSQTGVKP